jgi:hypothetical protein
MPIIKFLAKYPWLAALAGLTAVLFFHSPRWWLLAHESPGTFEWDRALVYLKQCQGPFRADVEPAMRWRWFPQVIVFLCGGSRWLALLFPWLGVWAFLCFVFKVVRTETPDELTSFLITIVIGSTSPVLISTGWLGMNDAWVVLGLCYLAFGRRAWVAAIVCCLCPFIDERFVFGVPAAILIRTFREYPDRPAFELVKYAALRTMAALIPFLAVRLIGAGMRTDTAVDKNFFAKSIRESSAYLCFAPAALWMALRFAYYPLARTLQAVFKPQPVFVVILLAAAFLPVLGGFVLASDMTRTAGILTPLALWGALEVRKRAIAVDWSWLAIASLVVPAAHVTYTKIAVINSLPVELWRLWR